MTNTILTQRDPEAAARYYAEGLWRRDTVYNAADAAYGVAPRGVRPRDGAQREIRPWTGGT